MISYSDSEVRVFHPICEKALNNALSKTGLLSKYEVLHHQHTGTLEMDFVVRNRMTGKYLCVVEVKRTPADVHSARYQYQAMSYVQSNEGQNEKPFYVLTNIEYACSFRYDSKRPRVFQQMLKPGFENITSFDAASDSQIEQKLSDYFANLIINFIDNKYDYLVTLEKFIRHMEAAKQNPKLWKSSLAVLLYEYIRGAFSLVNRKDFHDIRLFRKEISQICSEAVSVNFSGIFGFNSSEYAPYGDVDESLLTELFYLGEQEPSGDSIADALHEIVSQDRRHAGEVPTDPELGRITAELAFNISGELQENEKLCDPAAGSGNLISASAHRYNLQPSQVFANDVNPMLIELLSLRLGLLYVNTVSKNNSPRVLDSNLADLSVKDFEDVSVVILNPPFVRGVDSVERKNVLAKAIKDISGSISETNFGQMPLEAVFLELLLALVKPGTTVACILPKTHLTATSKEGSAIRRMLLTDFGLRTVFVYPGDKLFNDVTRDTCVVVGKAKTPDQNVKVIFSYDAIPDIDLSIFSNSLKKDLQDEYSQLMPGVIARNFEKIDLIKTIDLGWNELSAEMTNAVKFMGDNFAHSKNFTRLLDSGWDIRRGTGGNNGASDLIFNKLSAQNTLDLSYTIGMRNAKYDSFLITEGDSKVINCLNSDKTVINKVITDYYQTQTSVLQANGQIKKIKTPQELTKILEKDSNDKFKAGLIMLPRGIREIGKVFVSNKDVVSSTNFVVCSNLDDDEALIIGSWMSTIFYQIACEIYSKNQEGMRKMEVNSIKETIIPVYSHVSENCKKKIRDISQNISFVNLQKPIIRKIDEIWGEEIFGELAGEKTEEARRLLSYLVGMRKPK